MKIKLFNRELVADGYYSNGITKTRQETNEELETRVNEFMADKKVSSVQAYEDNIMVMYEEVLGNVDDFDNEVNKTLAYNELKKEVLNNE